jgi:hypothetical protein
MQIVLQQRSSSGAVNAVTSNKCLKFAKLELVNQVVLVPVQLQEKKHTLKHSRTHTYTYPSQRKHMYQHFHKNLQPLRPLLPLLTTTKISLCMAHSHVNG